MNRLIEEVAAVDPEFADTLLRNQRRSLVFAIVSVLAVLAAGYAIAVNFQQDTKIVRISACQEDPDGRECQTTKLEAEKAASMFVNCVPFWKAGYPCPKPGSAAARRQVRQAGGDATQPDPIAGQQPKPGKQPGHGHGDQHKAAVPHPKAPRHPKAPKPAPPPPTPTATPESPPSSAPPAEPGNSGNTPAAEHSNGVKACVDLVVSACVKAEAPVAP